MSSNELGFTQLPSSREIGRSPETLIIGAGAAGLAASHFLHEDHLLLDASSQPGDVWRNRYEGLRLFTPGRYCGLPGLDAPGQQRLGKDEYADYLADYAKWIGAPLQMDTTVLSHTFVDGRHVLSTNAGVYRASRVIVASGGNGRPAVPPFAPQLAPGIHQLHSSQFRHIDDLRPGPVLVVGAGQAGGDIAALAARSHDTYLSGRRTGRVPLWLAGNPALHYLVYGLPVPDSDAVRAALTGRCSPLIWQTEKDLRAAGVQRVPRTSGVRDGLPVVGGDRMLDVANVVWCTGFRPGFPWLWSGATRPDGYPLHRRGVSGVLPGLGFIGLPYQRTLRSGFLTGLAQDANWVVRAIHSQRSKVSLSRP